MIGLYLPETIKRPLRSLRSAIRKGIRNLRNGIFYLSHRYRGWQNSSSGFRTKSYRSYEEYVAHQSSKLHRINKRDMDFYSVSFRQLLRERLEATRLVQPGMTSLCLAARLGPEVQAFLDLGCFAVGVDLNPGSQNRYVLYGDFHHLQFPNHCVDLIYCNSLDHALYMDKLINEIKRVLKPSGHLIIEVAKGFQEGGQSERPWKNYYEATIWERLEDLVRALEERGLVVTQRASFTKPLKVEHLCLRVTDAGSSHIAEPGLVARGHE